MKAHISLDDFESSDVPMQQTLNLARAAAKTDLPVLILGESGTGKTLLAHAIHANSRRANSPLVSFNVAALSDTLLESQLFGHEKGAFTSADRSVKGKFELADHGTIFLDEIADMNLSAQAKILRVVEAGEFERLGSDKIVKADVRIISATHLPIKDYVASRRFRQDLFYRLCGITIYVPPLRMRPNDLPKLIGYEVRRASQQENKVITGISDSALKRLLTHAWPGNLRELSRVLQTAVALSNSEIITDEAVLIDYIDHSNDSKKNASSSVQNVIDELSLKVNETRHILNVLEKMGGNKRKTARALGVSRSTLDRKLAET